MSNNKAKILRDSKIGIVCCSNGQKISNSGKIENLKQTLVSIGLQPIFSDYIYEKEDVFSGSAKERAHALMNFYKDDEIKGIFDISGGDVANGVLPYLDYEVIANSSKLFWGYSDLTTVINAIYAKTGRPSALYQIRNLIYDNSDRQIADFCNTVIDTGNDMNSIDNEISLEEKTKRNNGLFDIKYRFVQGSEMKGVIVGGNIRCLLKLAGTEYMPDLSGKILLLESMSGKPAQMETYLCQLKQLGAFEKVAGVLLGTFTEMQREKCKPTIEEIALRLLPEDLPVAVTKDIGHGTDSKAVLIGQELVFKK